MTTTTNKGLNLPAYNQTSPTWNIPLNDNFGIIDSALGGSTSSINLAAGNYTLSSTEIQNMRIVVGGALGANRTVTFPAGAGGMWIITNNTTNSYTVTVQTASAGASVVAPQGLNLLVFSDGTNMYKADSGLISSNSSFQNIEVTETATMQQVLTSPTGITVTAGSFFVGQTYTITTVGSTDFTTIGASANTVGVKFVATGVGSGTGTATTIPYSLFIDGDLLPTGRVTPRVKSQTSFTSPLAWDSDGYDEYVSTAQANNLTINADSGTPVTGQKILFRFTDDGTARTLTWTTGSAKSFRAIGVTLPTTTVANKTVYVGCIFNSSANRWDVLAVGQEA